MAGTASIRITGNVTEALAALERLGIKAEETGAKTEAAFGDKLAAAGERTAGVFQRIGQTMGNWGIPLAGSVSKVGDHLAQAQTKGQKFGAAMQEMGKVTLVAGAAGFAALGAESVRLAGNFQSAAEHLVTDAGESQKALGGVEQGMLAVSQQTGTSATDIVNGMYHIESAGYHGAAGLAILKAAAEGAKVGNADLDTVSKTLTGTMRAYNIPASQSVSVMNQLIAAVGSGDMRMQDLASSLGNVAPIAAAAHVSLAQVGGAIATMTAQNMTAQQATQDLANLIRGLQAPNQVAVNEMAQFGLNANTVSSNLGKEGLTGTLDTLTKAITSKMGPSGMVLLNTFNQSQGAAKDLQAELSKMPTGLKNLADGFLSGKVTLKDWRNGIKALPADQSAMASGFLSTYNQAHKFNQLLTSGSPAAQTYTQALSKMTGGATGLNVALMLTGGNTAEFNHNVKNVADAAHKAGKNVDNWGAIQKTFNQQVEVAKTTAGDLGIKLGLVLIPKLEDVAHDTMDVVSWFEQHKAIAEALAGVIGGVLSVAVGAFAVNKLAGMVKGVKSAYKELQTLESTVSRVATTLLQKFGVIGQSAQQSSQTVSNAASTQATNVENSATQMETKVAASTAGMETEMAGDITAGTVGVDAAAEVEAAGVEGELAGIPAAAATDVATTETELAGLGGEGALAGAGVAGLAAGGVAAVGVGGLAYGLDKMITDKDPAYTRGDIPLSIGGGAGPALNTSMLSKLQLGNLSGFKGFTLPPGYAGGTPSWPGGWGLVGEKGPEIVKLPSGSQVYPNGTGPGGGPHISITANTNANASDIATEVGWVMRGG